jgi:hypothetical protein
VLQLRAVMSLYSGLAASIDASQQGEEMDSGRHDGRRFFQSLAPEIPGTATFLNTCGDATALSG